ncbi:MAG: hypothetical protein ACXWBO_18325, partial [Ilumatobacteraceae bacterium]
MTTEEESCTREELQRATVGAFADGDTLGSAPDALNFALQAICAELVAQRIDVERVDSIGRLVAGLFGMHEHASICSPFEAEDLADLRDLHKGLYELGARLHHRIRRDLGWPT